MTTGLFLALLGVAFAYEWVDASLGMGYGTLLTPTLLLFGFDPLVAVPAVLLSQAVGGFVASLFHHKCDNVDFTPGSTDLKIVFIIAGLGVVAAVLAAFISLHLPKWVLSAYIATLVTAIGILVLFRIRFSFSIKKMTLIGFISAFNKGLSGGGYGPIVTGGQILAGHDHKAAVGVTTLAEAPICIAGALTYLVGRAMKELPGGLSQEPLGRLFKQMMAPEMFNGELILALVLGSILVAPFGALTTKLIPKDKIYVLIGGLITAIGILSLVKIIAP